eukprot:180213-Chlamydomonas_euryale.AAC.4
MGTRRRGGGELGTWLLQPGPFRHARASRQHARRQPSGRRLSYGVRPAATGWRLHDAANAATFGCRTPHRLTLSARLASMPTCQRSPT